MVILALTVTASFRLIVRGVEAENQFLFILPLSASTIWQFLHTASIDISPMLFATSAFAFFSLPFKSASLTAGLLIVITLSGSVGGSVPVSFTIWLLILSIVWALLIWLQSHERQYIAARFENMERRAKGFITQSESSVPLDSLPELDSETKFVKAAANVFRLERVMGWITEIIQEVMHPHSCFFFFLDQQDKNLKVFAYKSSSRFFEPNTVINMDSPGILSWVIKQKQKIRHERLPREHQNPEYYNARERILALMVFPIVINDQVEGLLGVDARRSYSFGVDEEQLLELFTQLSADLIEAFRMYQHKDVHADYMSAFYQAVRQIIQARLDLATRLELLIKISNLIKKSDETGVAIPKDTGEIVIVDGVGDNVRKMVGGIIREDSTCGRLLQSGNDVMVLPQDAQGMDPKELFFPGENRLELSSLMLIALPMQRKQRGVLFMGSRKRNYYNEDDRFIFSTLAAQFGISLENAINLAKIQELAITDGLTGLYNHRYFQDSLQNEIKLARREPMEFSLMLLDIDHFKRFNDTYGHQAGDEVLKHLARLLKEHAREIDTVARYGGEEFVLILRQCELKMAGKTAERIRKACEKQRIKIGEDIMNITISVGVASYPVHAAEGARLIAIADESLYKAKREGRNRVELAPVVSE